MTEAERRAALEAVATEVRSCTRCRLHETRTRAVPGEGHPSTEVVFVGEGPGQNEDRQGRPFVGRAGDLLVKMLATIGWQRDEVFITNVVKCRPPDNRDPEPDEVAACAPYLRRQLEILDPALVVTLGRHSLGRFMPGARISQVHGSNRPLDPATGARAAIAYALYHPAAALRSAEVERQSYEDVRHIPAALLASREIRDTAESKATEPIPASSDIAPAPVSPAAPAVPAGIEAPRLTDAVPTDDPDAAGLASNPRFVERAGSDASDPGAERDLPRRYAIGGLNDIHEASTIAGNGSHKHGIHMTAGSAADSTLQTPAADRAPSSESTPNAEPPDALSPDALSSGAQPPDALSSGAVPPGPPASAPGSRQTHRAAPGVAAPTPDIDQLTAF